MLCRGQQGLSAKAEWAAEVGDGPVGMVRATLQLAQGATARETMEILGHSQINLTMNTCTHVIPDLQRRTNGRMDELFGP